MSDIRAITLDLDDTLWPIEPVIRNAERSLWAWLNEHYPEINNRWTAERLLEFRIALVKQHPDKAHDFRFLRKKALRHVAIDSGYTEDLVEPAFDVFDRARNQVTLFPEVEAELERLAESFTLVAITNGNASLKRIGLDHHFADIVTSVDIGVPKPHPRIFEETLRRSGLQAESTLHVGDHPETDVFGALNAGMQAAWINRDGTEWPAEFGDVPVVVESLTALREYAESRTGS